MEKTKKTNVSFAQKRRRETVTKGCMRWFVWDSCTEHNSPLKAALCLWRHIHPTITFPLYPRQTLTKEATDAEALEWENHSAVVSNYTVPVEDLQCLCKTCSVQWTMPHITTVTSGEVDGMDVWICFGGRRQRINGRQQATSGFHRNYLLEVSAVLVEAGGGGKITRERR